MTPAVQHAIEAIQRQLELVQLELPELPPLQQLQLARSRCPEEIIMANISIDRAGMAASLPVSPPAAPGRTGRHSRWS
jgi:hypothetical protein